MRLNSKPNAVSSGNLENLKVTSTDIFFVRNFSCFYLQLVKLFQNGVAHLGIQREMPRPMYKFIFENLLFDQQHLSTARWASKLGNMEMMDAKGPCKD
jgi:hypothetical protein